MSPSRGRNFGWPTKPVDHIDGNRANNRWNNLRQVSLATNQHNQRQQGRKNNTSGYVGVVKVTGQARWRATIKVHGKRHYLGTFKTIEEAAAAYQEGKKLFHGDAFCPQTSGKQAAMRLSSLLLGNARNLNLEGERAREHLRLAIDHIATLNGALEDLASLGATIAICGTKYDDAAARKVLGPGA